MAEISTCSSITEYLASFGILSDEEIKEFGDKGSYRTLAKDEILFQEGFTTQQFAFLQSGIMRSCYRTSLGEEITYCFNFPGHFITTYGSFITQMPSRESMQAITEAEVILFPKSLLHELEQSSNNWLKVTKAIAEAQYVYMEQRVFLLQKEKAEVKYEELLSTNPQLVQQIPLTYLASYLGITPRHLSRIRKQISK